MPTGDFPVIPSSSKLGQGMIASAKITPEMFRDMEILRQSGQFPYKTNSDLIRHAIYNHINMLSDMAPGVAPQDHTNLLIEIARREKEMAGYQDVFKELGGVIDEHMFQGAEDDARRVVEQAWNIIYGIPEGSMRIRYERIMERFEALGPSANVKGPVSLKASKVV